MSFASTPRPQEAGQTRAWSSPRPGKDAAPAAPPDLSEPCGHPAPPAAPSENTASPLRCSWRKFGSRPGGLFQGPGRGLWARACSPGHPLSPRVTLCLGDAEPGGVRSGSQLHSGVSPGPGGHFEGAASISGLRLSPCHMTRMCLYQPCQGDVLVFYCTHFTDEKTQVQTCRLGKAPTLPSRYFSLWLTAGG